MTLIEVHEGRGGLALKVTGKVEDAKWVPYAWMLLQAFPPEAGSRGSRSFTEVKLYIESPEVLQRIARLAAELAKELGKKVRRAGGRRRSARGQWFPAP